MPFDAGTIVARLDLDEQEYNRKLDAAERRKEQFERKPVKLNTTEVFSQADEAKARKTFADMDNQLSRDAMSRMRSGNGSLLGTLMSVISPRQLPGAPTAQQSASQGLLGKIFGGVGGGGGSSFGGGPGSTGGGNQGLGTGLFKGIGPGILGLSTRASLISGLGGSLLATLPALAGSLGALGIGGAGLGVAALGAKTLIGTKQQPGQLYDPAQGALKQLQATLKSAAQPLVDPLKQVFAQLPSLLRGVGPALKSAFAGAATLIQPTVTALASLAKLILPELGQSFREVAPLIGPLIVGLGKLVAGILPGLNDLLKASRPAVAALGDVLGSLGSGIGHMLADFAPAIRSSSIVLLALGKLIGGLFPIIGQLAGVLAKTLAPIFVQLAAVITALEPTLAIVGKVFAALAGAILGDLVSAFGALAKLIISIQPAIQIFAKALSQAFTVLENSGVFAVLGDALEAIVPALGKLINTLVGQLAPILPVIITLVSQFSTILIDLLAAGLTTILTGVTDLLTKFHFLVPLLGILTAAWVAFDIATAANPIGLIVIAIVAVIGAITLLVTHWKQVWGDIKNWAADAWNFIWNGFGKYLLPLLGPAGLIVLGIDYLDHHWSQVMGDLKQAASDLWQWLWSDFGAKIVNFFTQTLPNAADQWWTAIKNTWADIETRFLQGVSHIIGIMAKLPGPLGAPFRAAQQVINGQLNQITGDVGKMSQNVINDFGKIHGKTVSVTFQQVFGGQPNSLLHPKGAKAMGGGIGSAGMYLVGEQGPELTWMPAGAHVMPAGPTAKILGGLASGTGWDFMDRFSPAASMWPPDINSWFSKGENAYIAQVIASGVLKKAWSWATGGAPGSLGGPTSASAAQAQAYALSRLGAYGWGASQMSSLIPLWNQESGWNRFALNPSSGAYGIPQALPASKMGAAANPPTSSAAAQINWGLGYIRGRYGSPAGAEAHELAYHWYDRGGWLNPGPMNGTGQPEAVLTPPQSSALLAMAEAARLAAQGSGGSSRAEQLLERIIAAVDRNAAATGQAVGHAINGGSRRAFYGAQYQTSGV